MSVASRYGKLFVSADDDGTRAKRVEDLLTSDIFGAYRYLPVQLGIGRLLAAATNVDNVTLADWAARRGVNWLGLSSLHLRFWPSLAGKEPDIVLALGGDDGPALAVLIEVKLHSDQHMIDNVSQVGFYGRAFQKGVFKDAPFDFDLPPLRPVVFMTNHAVMPLGDIAKAREEVAPYAEGTSTDVFWASWPASLDFAGAALDELKQARAPAHQVAVLEDIIADLENRGVRRRRTLLPFPMPTLVPLDPFPPELVERATRSSRRSLTDLTQLTLARVDAQLADWTMR